MKQILQNLGTGETLLVDVPAPGVQEGCLLVQTQASLVSLGTEKMLVDFGRASLLDKARKQPEKVRQVLQKIRTDGLFTTIDAVRTKLAEPIPLGYCATGIVAAVGAGVDDFSVGDRVACAAPHAEVVCVPRNLCAKVPENVPPEEAVFTVLGAIALQGVRLLNPGLGDNVAVVGLGLVGLLATQLLVASGARVLGTDFDPAKCALARSLGAEAADLSTGLSAADAVNAWSAGHGADAVLVAASSPGSAPMLQALEICRKRGRIVQVGVTGVELPRPPLYEKEITVQVSCSYGPGRYDEHYEQDGVDYPYPYVRWTQRRNFEAILDLLARRRLHPARLISHRIPFENALEAYQIVAGQPLRKDAAGTSTEGENAALGGSPLGIVLCHTPAPGKLARTLATTGGGTSIPGQAITASATPPASPSAGARAPTPVVLGVLGTGNFTARTLLPAIRGLGARLRTIVSAAGSNAALLARKYGFEQSSTDARAVFDDPATNAVIITTRHSSHAAQALAALEAGKHVFIEKPLCLHPEELEAIATAARARPGQIVMVGFNRRFSPHTIAARRALAATPGPKSMVFTANAGAIPASHWLQNPVTGGGRIIGEACHYIDLLRHLAGAPVVRSEITWLEAPAAQARDTASIQLAYADGSTGTVHYFANGSKSFPKERLEIFAAGRVLVVDNFRKTTGYGTSGGSKLCGGWKQDKGHAAGFAAFFHAIETGAPAPIPLEEILETTRVTHKLAPAGRTPPSAA
ncbi:MAG: bi-domain-containing oxidoreductase [Puniceicoccales bacterium]|jgi:predicted dehydrogenase/threonine dehydrogenase-like Zn-dependent dehydrogenase|nr:bi-domain-containing oxidoreductase [Puniceicoccales bacterium]